MRVAAQDTPLMHALGLAHHWQRLVNAGRFASITEIAEAEGFNLGRASRIARFAQLAQLAPSIVECLRNRCGCQRHIGKRQPSCHASAVGRAA